MSTEVKRVTDNGKGWLMVGVAFIIGVAICAVVYLYNNGYI